jgi:hypothetical protein
MKRRSFAEVEARARASQRADDIAEMCRVLRHHLDMGEAADALWEEMQKPTPKQQTRAPWAS